MNTDYKLLNKDEELKKLKEKALTNQHIQAIFSLQELHKISDEELFLYMTLKFVELSDGYLKTLNDQLRKKNIKET